MSGRQSRDLITFTVFCCLFMYFFTRLASGRKLRRNNVTVNLWVVNQPWLFSLMWCVGASSVTTNSCHLLKEMKHPCWVMVSKICPDGHPAVHPSVQLTSQKKSQMRTASLVFRNMPLLTCCVFVSVASDIHNHMDYSRPRCSCDNGRTLHYFLVSEANVFCTMFFFLNR